MQERWHKPEFTGQIFDNSQLDRLKQWSVQALPRNTMLSNLLGTRMARQLDTFHPSTPFLVLVPPHQIQSPMEVLMRALGLSTLKLKPGFTHLPFKHKRQHPQHKRYPLIQLGHTLKLEAKGRLFKLRYYIIS